jgi:hypothetical protein
LTLVPGLPLICGGELAATTLIEKVGSDDALVPSLTVMTMPP